jgi:diguanylate cyclase (GGDEF)-like protein/PAS domain S-box-containing protein
MAWEPVASFGAGLVRAAFASVASWRVIVGRPSGTMNRWLFGRIAKARLEANDSGNETDCFAAGVNAETPESVTVQKLRMTMAALTLQLKELREREADYRILAENATDMICRFNLSLFRTYSSPSCKEVLGYDSGELIGRSPLAIVHPDDIDKVSTVFASVIEGTQRASVVGRVRHKSGRWIWVDAKLRLLLDPITNEPTGVLSALRDITDRKSAEAAVLASESRWNFALEGAGQGVWDLDLTRGRTYYSPVWKSMLGYDTDELSDDPDLWLNLIHPDDRERVLVADRDHLAGKTPHFEAEFRMRHKSGRWIWILDRGKILEKDAQGRAVRAIGTHTDITRQKEAHAEMRVNEERFRSIFALSPVGMGLVDVETGSFITQSRSLCELVGVGEADFASLRLETLVSGGLTALPPIVGAPGKDWTFGPIEIDLKRTDGAKSPVMLSGSSVAQADGSLALLLVFQDISSRRGYEEQLWALANIDNLTALPNRMQFNAKLQDAIERAKRTGKSVAIAFLDVDRFKEVNDSFGHDAGDRLLKSVADRIKPIIRSTDTLARLGGDEFAIIFADLADALHLHRPLDAIVTAIREPVGIGNAAHSYTCSIGVAVYPLDGIDAVALLKNADIALYRAKALGRNRYEFFEKQMLEDIELRTRLRGDVLSALDAGHFELIYQPIVKARNQACIGFEALPSWTSKAKGKSLESRLDDFEADPVIASAIGKKIVEIAISQAADWHGAGVDFGRIAINLTAVDFKDEGFVDGLIHSLALSGVTAPQFKIEVNESALIGPESDRILTALERLRDFGMEIVYDGFGTSYTSLTQIKSFPIDLIKINKAFVEGLRNNPEDQAIVIGLIDLVHRLGIATAADGVSDYWQADFLSGIGCDQIQGGFIEGPMPASDVAGYIRLRNDEVDWMGRPERYVIV